MIIHRSFFCPVIMRYQTLFLKITYPQKRTIKISGCVRIIKTSEIYPIRYGTYPKIGSHKRLEISDDRSRKETFHLPGESRRRYSLFTGVFKSFGAQGKTGCQEIRPQLVYDESRSGGIHAASEAELYFFGSRGRGHAVFAGVSQLARPQRQA